MSTLTLSHTNGSTNGSKPTTSIDWLQQSVQKFFTAFNWEDHSPEVQEIKLTVAQGDSAALSLTMSVKQFFTAIPWEGQAIATSAPTASPLTKEDSFTLEDFSDLF